METESSNSVSVCSSEDNDVSPNSEPPSPPKLCRLEHTNTFIFKMFKYLGFITVTWKGDHYSINKWYFTISYTLWFILPTFGVVLSAWSLSQVYDENLSTVYNTEEDRHSSIVYVFCVAVVPSLQAFTIRMISKGLPDTLYKIAEIDARQSKHRKNISMAQVLFPYLNISKKAASSSSSSQSSIFTFLPVMTLLISIVAFWTLWTLTLLEAIESIDISVIVDEWLHFTLIIVYGIMVFFSNWFCAIVIEWFRVTYAVFDISLKTATEADLKEMDSTLFLVSECFYFVSNNFLAYICTLNTIINTVSSIFSFVKLFSGFEMVFYMIPLFFSVNMIWFLCYHSSKLSDQVSKTEIICCSS